MGYRNILLLTGWSMDPCVVVFVHPVNTLAHPTVPAGWRWAVMVGQGPAHELDRCANAGWAPSRYEAELEGEVCGVAACKAARMFGVPAEWGAVIVLDTDPIPSGADLVSVLG